VTVKRKLNAADTENVTWEYELSVALVKLGRSQLQLGRIDDALASLDEARTRFTLLLGSDGANALWRWSLVDGLSVLLDADIAKGDTAAARAVAQEGLAVLQAADLEQLSNEFGPGMKRVRDRFQEFLSSTQVP
jgi:hypothetical protein